MHGSLVLQRPKILDSLPSGRNMHLGLWHCSAPSMGLGRQFNEPHWLSLLQGALIGHRPRALQSRQVPGPPSSAWHSRPLHSELAAQAAPSPLGPGGPSLPCGSGLSTCSRCLRNQHHTFTHLNRQLFILHACDHCFGTRRLRQACFAINSRGATHDVLTVIRLTQKRAKHDGQFQGDALRQR